MKYFLKLQKKLHEFLGFLGIKKFHEFNSSNEFTFF
jgi:hypothetical protein